MPATPPIPTADGTAALPFASYTDEDGNLWICPGPVIALHGTTTVFEVGTGGYDMGDWRGGANFSPAAGAAAQNASSLASHSMISAPSRSSASNSSA